MLRKTVDKAKRTWAFSIAAISLPLSYILLFPCFGIGCASCPSGGACLISVPLMVVLVLVGKSFARIKKAVSRLVGN